MIQVSFEHWRYIFPEDILIKYGSPHNKGKAKQLLCSVFKQNAQRLDEDRIEFSEDQLLCANEAFPEAAVADPLADLVIWDEWSSGIRTFPYPGHYSRLAIINQPGKTSSPSSVGVIGEIMAGLFGQELIAPWVLVRVIRKWPDFIFYIGGGRYAFLEAKAFTGELNGSGISVRVQDNLLGECLFDAIQQLNADSFVKVWGAFTHIQSITPTCFATTFIELDVGEERRQKQSQRIMPSAVVTGLAKRAIDRSTSKLSSIKLSLLSEKKKSIGEDVKKQLIYLANQEVEEILHKVDVELATGEARNSLEEEIKRQVRLAMFSEKEGQRFLKAKEVAVTGELTPIRQCRGDWLCLKDLTIEERAKIEAEWKPDWRKSNQAWKELNSKRLWRCSSTAFCLERKEEGD